MLKEESGICKCCGQTLPRDFLFVGTDKSPLSLNGIKLRIFNEVSKAGSVGINSERLHDRVYAGTRDGGPGAKGLTANVAHLNKILRPLGKEVSCGRGGSRQYRLVDFK